jgi:O-antigen/teichoic acid export membrane protein
MKSGLWMGIRQFFILIIGMIFVVTFARIASRELYGQYQLVLSIIATFSVVSISGLNTSILQSIARGFEGDYRKAVLISFKWSLLLGTPIFILIGIYHIYQNQLGLGYSFLIVSLFFPFLYSTNTWESFVQGKERFDLLAKYSIIRTILNTSLLILILIIFKENLILLVLAYVSSISISNYFFYKKTNKFSENQKKDPNSIKYGWFLTKINGLNLFFSKIDYLLVGYFLGIESLAVYSIGMTFGVKIKDLFKVIFSVLSPQIARKGFDKKINYLVIFLAFSMIAGILYFILPTVINVLFSSKYEDSIYISQIYILFLPIFITGLLAENHLSFFSKNKKVIFFTSLLSPIIKFALMLILLINFGIIGLILINGFYPAIRMAFIYMGFKLLK